MLWIVQFVELYDFNSVACCMLTPALVGGGNAEFYVGGIFFPKRRCQPKELKAAKHPNAKMWRNKPAGNNMCVSRKEYQFFWKV